MVTQWIEKIKSSNDELVGRSSSHFEGNILTIGLTSHDDPIPGKKVIYAHMLAHCAIAAWPPSISSF